MSSGALHSEIVEALRQCGATLKISGTKNRVDGSFDTFVVYIVDVTIGKHTFQIYRRFKQFKTLDNHLRMMFSNESFPDIPKKRLFKSSMDKGLITSRLNSLQKYLDFISSHKDIISSQPIIQWLGPKNNPGYLPLDHPDYTGVLIKQGHVVRNWKARYFLLKGDLLYYFRSSEELSPLGVIPLDGAKLASAEKMRPLCFKITPHPRSKLQPFFIQASTKKKYEGWMEALGKAINPTKMRKERFTVEPKQRPPPSPVRQPLSPSEHIPSSIDIAGASRKKPESFAKSYTDKPDRFKYRASTLQGTRESHITSLLSPSGKPRDSLTKSHREYTYKSYDDSSDNNLLRRTGSEGKLECLVDSQQIKHQIRQNLREEELHDLDELKRAKQCVDDELLGFIKSINLELVKAQFLAADTMSNDEEILLSLKGMATKFKELSLEELGEGDFCKEFVERIQHISVAYPDSSYRNYVTVLLFIVSPVSRLILIHHSKTERTNETKSTPRITNKNFGQQSFTAYAIARCLRTLFAGMGVSFIDTIQQTRTKDTLDLFKRRSEVGLSVQSKRRSPTIDEKNIRNNLLLLSRVKTNPAIALQPVKNTLVTCSLCRNEFYDQYFESHKVYCARTTSIAILPLDKDVEHHPEAYLSQLLSYVDIKISKITKKQQDKEIPVQEYILYEEHRKVLESIRDIIHETADKANNFEKDLTKLRELREKYKNSSEASIFVFANFLYAVLKYLHDPSIISPPIAPFKHHEEKKKTFSSKDVINEFEFVKPISRGAFGRVDLVKRKNTTDLEIYAMKTLKKRAMIDKNLVEQVMAERNIVEMAENPYVVTVYQAFQTDTNLYLLMEFLPGGDCASLIENISYFDEDMARLYIAETIMALDYLHTNGIIHRDVKPDNLLISRDGHIKLTDFGLSLPGMLDRNNTTTLVGDIKPAEQQGSHRVVGTPDYLAPEALLGTGGGKPTIDWWSVGITLFEFLTGIPPFNDETPEKIFQHILDCNIPWPIIPDEMSETAQDLIQKLLCENPDERLGANGVEEIKSHPFFENIDWDNLYLEPRHSTFVPRFMDEFDTGYFIPRADVEEGGSFTGPSSSEDERRSDLFAGFSFSKLPPRHSTLRQTISDDSDDILADLT